MTALLDAPLAIVDLETTGAHPAYSRITEIAVVEVNEGDVVSEWSTLLNPGTAIPAGIQALTGITNEMVASAPAFADLAREIHERLDGRVFVAHNARFDYGFLRHEFERAGLRFHARTLCTVKLSRRLYPAYRRHSLDSLIERHGLRCPARHRALGDAQAVWEFLRVAENEQGVARLQEVARNLSKLPALPPHIERSVVDAIPEAPGAYLFYGEGETLLYVGKSVAMRSRVLQHFSGDLNSPREQQIARELRRIEWRRTCGELGALLLEARLVKTLKPAFNRQLKDAKGLCGFSFDSTRLNLEENESINSETLPFLHGIFRSRRSALAALRELAAEHGLCLQTLGFERARKGACFHHQIQRCSGVCAGKESPHQHLARVGAALARLKLPAWPWRGPVGVIERDAERDATEVHVVDQWCWLGTAQSDTEVSEILEGARRARFDLDHFRIFTRHLREGRARVVELRAEQRAAA
ncbi:MAG TPA: exonuclease domain-containing protein [Burkholderiales bacterium]|nr:exonuclease domain-containing protein [Burkholderiales bacterium]HEX2649224.1 exonuclease domain-containing protein [Burkholderiales bacterium]